MSLARITIDASNNARSPTPPLPPSYSIKAKNLKSMAPNHLPPKSPASISGRRLLSSVRGSSRRRSSSRSSSRGRGRRRSKSRSRRENSSRSVSDTSSEHSSASESECASSPRIADPSPIHLTVETDTDDLSNSEHFSQLSFEKSTQEENPLSDPNSQASHERRTSDRPNLFRKHRRSQRRSSWDSNSYDDLDPVAAAAAGIGTKTCLAVPRVLRRQRVMTADVASVGNASDTLVSIVETTNGKGRGRITGRELHETAKAAMNEGDYEEALQMFEALLNAQLARFGVEEHSSVGAALHNVGVVRLRIGDAEEAEEAFLRALVIRRNLLEPNDLDLAATLAKLGSARTALGKFDEGLFDLREALKISQSVFGRNHRTVAQILCHIGCLYFEAGEMYSAQSTFEDALAIYREAFQVDTDRDACMAQLTENLCNIGSIQNRRKNFSGAIESFKEALYLQRGILGHDHPRVIATLDNLAYSFSKSKLYNQALACYKEMLNAQISHYGSFSDECCDTLSKQALIYGKLKNFDDAIQVVTKHLESIRVKSELEPVAKNDPVAEEVNQMLNDLQTAKKKAAKSKSRKGRRERSLDCFDRILFDKLKDRRNV